MPRTHNNSDAMACLLGSCDSWDMIRPLGLAGIKCALVSDPDDHVRYSRFADVVIDRVDANIEPEELFKRLAAFSKTQSEKPVLYYATDADLLFVSRYRKRLAEYFHFVIADAEHVEVLQNKNRFRLLANELNLPVPASQNISPRQQSPSSVELPFPLIVKPAEREIVLKPGDRSVRDLVGEDVKCIRVANHLELENIWSHLETIGVDFIAQEMIPGPETLIESYHAYVDQHGTIVAEFSGRKVRTFREEFGYSTVLVTTDAPQVMQLGANLVEKIGVTGILKFDFKRYPDGSLGLLEINPRFSLWQHLGAKAGVDFQALAYRDLTNQPRGPVGTAREGVTYSRLRDFHAARERNMSMLRWLFWMLGTEAKEVALDDPRPLLKRAQLKLSQWLSKSGYGSVPG